MKVKLMDMHIIRVDRVWDDRPVEGIVPMNAAYWVVEKELDRYERKLLEGVVHAIPMAYSESEFMPIDEGTPAKRIFIGHDIIQQQRNYGRLDWDIDRYHPGLNERYKFLPPSFYGAMIDLKVGEKVYFHPSVTESENLLEDNGEYKLYVARVDQLICSGGPDIRPQGGFILVDPIVEDVPESEFILPDAEPVLLEGIVRHARPGSGFNPGDHVYYLENSDWVMNVEGVKYFAMREEEIGGVKLSA